ncbi:MAG: hypothetical protein ACREQC_08400 [Candidatus Binataceae bacterium]
MAVIETFYPYNAFVDESRQDRLGSAMYPAVFGVAAYVAAFDRLMTRYVELVREAEQTELVNDG